MSYGNTVTITGNVTRDPELKYTQGGAAVTSFSVAWNTKSKEGKETVGFFDVVCWRDLAENVAESLTKGVRVVIHGRLDHQTWEDRNGGGKRSKVEIVADEVAPSLRWATATVTKTPRSEGGSTGPSAPTPQGEPWAVDEAPF